MMAACTHRGRSADDAVSVAVATAVGGVTFSADSAYRFCMEQCAFGPRVMNTSAHDSCGAWIAAKFSDYGYKVTLQQATVRAFNGTPLQMTNIIAEPEGKAATVMLCAHWDTRPWADNDPSVAKHAQPVMGANDGASGVAVMLEIARVLAQDTTGEWQGVAFVCFDAEDYGDEGDADSWALGAQYWAARNTVAYDYAILLDMVGGEGAHFYKEGMSCRYAPKVVERVWSAARDAGYSGLFPATVGGYVTDDHIAVNEVAGIPCADIIPYYPDCAQSSFGPTWHTTDDTMEHIAVTTLKGVGETVLRCLGD